MARKHDALDVVNMYARMTLEEWKFFLVRAAKSGNVDKLIAYRYGLQAGLTDAVSKGMKNDKLDMWVIKRCRDIERCARFVYRKMYPNPMVDPKKDPTGYVKKAVQYKRMRDKAFEDFLMRSNF
jgi:hypothetical protein